MPSRAEPDPAGRPLQDPAQGELTSPWPLAAVDLGRQAHVRKECAPICGSGLDLPIGEVEGFLQGPDATVVLVHGATDERDLALVRSLVESDLADR